MIVTVTANPSVDKTAKVDKLLVGGLNRLAELRTDLAGKGINVARVAHTLGGQVLATGLLGREGGAALLAGLEAAGIAGDFVMVDGAPRTNLKLVDAAGTLTELNEPGIPYDAASWRALEQKLLQNAAPGGLYVLCGSLPPGAPQSSYRGLCAALKARGAEVLVDADGEAFSQAMEVPPDYIKPNRHELLEYFGAPQDAGLVKLRALCGRLLARGVKLVALSMGADGALFATQQECFHAPGLRIKVASPVGAGDSMVAALACAAQQKLPLREAATLAMACGAAAVATPGTAAPPRALIEEMKGKVELQRLD